MAQKKGIAAIVRLTGWLKCSTSVDGQEQSWIQSLETQVLPDGRIRTTVVIEAAPSELEDWSHANARECVDTLKTPRQWRLSQGYSS